MLNQKLITLSSLFLRVCKGSDTDETAGLLTSTESPVTNVGLGLGLLVPLYLTVHLYCISKWISSNREPKAKT